MLGPKDHENECSRHSKTLPQRQNGRGEAREGERMKEKANVLTERNGVCPRRQQLCMKSHVDETRDACVWAARLKAQARRTSLTPLKIRDVPDLMVSPFRFPLSAPYTSGQRSGCKFPLKSSFRMEGRGTTGTQ